MTSIVNEPKFLVLFVEDESAVREHIADVFSDEFEMQTAGSGEEALSAILKRRPDLIVTDIVLPGIDGVELVRLLRDRPSTASIPILMISGRTADELRAGFELGADAYLGKPYSERELRIRVRSMLRNAQIRAEKVRQEERAEAERRAVSERASLLESITDAFFAVGSDWRVTYANQRALDYFRGSREQFLGKVIWDVFPNTTETLVHQELHRAINERVSVSFEYLSAVANGWIELHAYPHQQGLAVHFRDVSDRKRSEELIRESETRLRLMSDALPALVSYFDVEYRYRFCNRRYEEWFGLSSDQIVGRTMSDVLGESAFAMLKPVVDRALAGERVSLEARVAYRLGGSRDVHIYYLPEKDSSGKVRGYYALVQDISERKRAELLLRESEARFRSLADNAPVMVWVTEEDGSCSYLSKSWYEFTGQTPQSGLGFGWLTAVHPEDMAAAQHSFIEANRKHIPFRHEYRLRRVDGQYVWAIDAASPRFNEAGDFLGYVGSVIDIQDRREAEERLRTLNELLEQQMTDVLAERKLFADVVEGTDAFVQVVDRNFRWLAINRASAEEFERIYGIQPKVGDSMLELLADKPEHQARVKEVWSRALAGERFSEVGEFGHTAHDRRFYEMKYNTLRDKEGRLIGAYQFVYDVTQRMSDHARLIEAQDALRQSQKMETLGQLTGGVAHDFNNLLTPIVGALDLLSRRSDGDSRVQRLTSGALQAADRAKTLIQRLLAFSRRQHLEARAVDIAGLLLGLRDLLTRTLGPHVVLSMETDAQIAAARVDPNQLELALLNLAVNARDAMPDGGSLVVHASEVDISESKRLAAGRYIRISVKDTGHGMDAATLSRAIEPFFTTKGIGQGTGLGLSMVHGLAAQSGGDFELQSLPGHGTTALLWLPIADEPAAVGEPAEELRTAAEVFRATVLLVDDEALVRFGTSAMLADGGYNVVEASSADEALQLVRNGLRVEAVVTDFAMPGRNGAQLARELRQINPRLPILMITGFASLTDTEAGGVPRLAKPFRQTELMAILGEVMSHVG